MATRKCWFYRPEKSWEVAGTLKRPEGYGNTPAYWFCHTVLAAAAKATMIIRHGVIIASRNSPKGMGL